MNDEERIRWIGNRLIGRVRKEFIDDALSYIDRSETVLSFETLCDFAVDYNVLLSDEEYKAILDVAHNLHLPIENRYLYIDPKQRALRGDSE